MAPLTGPGRPDGLDGHDGRADRGDEGARPRPPTFDDFVISRGPALVQLAHALSGDRQLAQDIVQDVLVTAMTKWQRVSRADDVDVYVRRMVVNRLHSWWRRAARRETPRENVDLPLRPGRDQVDDQVDGLVDGLADREALLRALAGLPVKQRTVLVLRHYEGCSDVEIADLLSCPTATVRSHALRGIRRLRAALSEEVGR